MCNTSIDIEHDVLNMTVTVIKLCQSMAFNHTTTRTRLNTHSGKIMRSLRWHGDVQYKSFAAQLMLMAIAAVWERARADAACIWKLLLSVSRAHVAAKITLAVQHFKLPH